MIPEFKWRWYGNAGHFIAGNNCRFHLCTVVGDTIVSTVGQYLPDSAVREILAKSRGVVLEGRGDERERVWLDKVGFEDIGYDRKFETMSFKAGKPCTAKDCGCGMPTHNGHEIDFESYNDAKSATEGHMRICRKVARRQKDK